MPSQEQRDIDLSLERSAAGWSINWSRSENVEAVLMQVTGTIADISCESCLRGAGPFQGCVVSELCGRGACANCYYGSDRRRCNLRRKAADVEELAQPAAPPAPPATPAAPAQGPVTPAAPISPAARPNPLAARAASVPPATAAALPAVITPFFVPAVIPPTMSTQDKRAMARRLREAAKVYDQAVAEDMAYYSGA